MITVPPFVVHRGARTMKRISLLCVFFLGFFNRRAAVAFTAPPLGTSGRYQQRLSPSSWNSALSGQDKGLPMIASDQQEQQEEVLVKRLPDSCVEITIPVPGSATKAAYDKVCTELSKNIQIPGFRKGSKIPSAVLEQAMSAKGGRNALKVQAINELINQLVESTLREQALDPIGSPILQKPAEELADTYRPGEALALPIKCDVWPEIQWKTVEGKEKPYVGLAGKYSRKPFNRAKMDKALTDLKERYATTEDVQDDNYELQMGDACTVQMDGYLATPEGNKGEPLPSSTASGDNVEVILGKGRYMEGLVEGLIGATKGETRTVKVSFPEKLRDKTLAGKPAIFDVKVLSASKRTVPELTDEFASTVRAGLTVDSLLMELRKAIDEEDSKEFKPARNSALGQALAKVMDVEVPDTLVTNQAREKFAVMMAEMREGGTSDEEIKKQINPENFQKYKNIVKDDIVKDFKISMASDEIARLEGITVPDFQVQEQMEAIRKDAQEDEEFDEKVVRAKVETTLVRQAVMDWLAEQSNLEVEYQDEEEFDEALMQNLADETIAREAKEDASGVTKVVPKTETPVAESVDEEKATSASDKEEKYDSAKNFEKMSLEDQAFQSLVDSGAVTVHKNPDDLDYDHSADDEYVQ